MTYGIGTPEDFAYYERGRLFRKLASLTVPGAAALTVSGLVGGWILYARPTPITINHGSAPVAQLRTTRAARAVIAPVLTPLRRGAIAPVLMPLRERKRFVASNPYGTLLDPSYSLGFKPRPLAQSAPLAAEFAAVPPTSSVASAGTAELVASAPPANTNADTKAPVPNLRPSDLKVAELENVPLPTPRPPELGMPVSRSHAAAPPPKHPASQNVAEQEAPTPPASAPSDNRNFFQKLFGERENQGPGLAYASEEEGLIGNNAQRLTGSAEPPYDRFTAVYNIAAHTVYLPDGTRLEAHSGLGSFIDDPHHVNAKMRGPTPPDIYELRPREALFHGVAALRLIPVGNGRLYGRNGLLAHTYMLGPSGQSFGCVSFKNYRKFLEAYQHGQIRRLVVVAGL